MGLKKFFEWSGKTPDQILQERKEDLTQRPNEDLVTYRNRAQNYAKIIEQYSTKQLEESVTLPKVRNGSSLWLTEDQVPTEKE